MREAPDGPYSIGLAPIHVVPELIAQSLRSREETCVVLSLRGEGELTLVSWPVATVSEGWRSVTLERVGQRTSCVFSNFFYLQVKVIAATNMHFN